MIERESGRWTLERVLVLAESAADVVVVGRRLDGGVLLGRIVGVVLCVKILKKNILN